MPEADRSREAHPDARVVNDPARFGAMLARMKSD
jgi:hypothetical protein